MKKIIIGLLALSLGGCASLPSLHAIQTVAQLGTASIANPITKERLSQIEQAGIVVFASLNTWKDQCRRGVIPAACKDQIAHVQVFTRPLPTYLKQLRAFMKNDDQVNAVVVFNRITETIAAVKAAAVAHNIEIRS